MTVVQDLQYRCTRCSSNLVAHNGEYVCSICGLVHGNQIINSINYVEFIPAKKTYNKTKFARMRKLNHTDANLHFLHFTGKFSQIARNLKVTDQVINRGLFLLKSIYKQRHLINKKVFLAPIGVNCLIKAIRENAAGIRLKEVIKEFQKYFPRMTYKIVSKMRYRLKEILDFHIPRANCKDYLSKVISIVLHHETIIAAIKSQDIDPFTFKIELTKRSYKITEQLLSMNNIHGDGSVHATAIVYLAAKQICKEQNFKKFVFLQDISHACIGASESHVSVLAREFSKLLIVKEDQDK